MVIGSDGPLLIMLHGLVSGSIATWCFGFAPALAKHYRVVLYDMRGHGKSERVGSGFDLDTLAADLGEVIKHYQQEFHLEDEPVHLAGHSYGALVALHYTLKTHQMGEAAVSSLALIDAPLPASKYIYPSLQCVDSEARIEEMAAALTRHLKVEGSRRKKKLLEHLRYLFMDTTMKRDVSLSEDYEAEQLKSLALPVLLVYGLKSDCYVVGTRLAELLPDSHLISMPCGHYITVEAPDALNRELDRFFLEEDVYG